MKRLNFFAAIMAASLLLSACKNEAAPQSAVADNSVKNKVEERQNKADREKLEELQKQYFQIPDEKMLDEGFNTPVYEELKGRYKSDARKLKELVEGTGAKLVFTLLSPGVEQGSAPGLAQNIAYVRNVCKDLGIDLIDFTPIIARKSATEITQVPKDGHWSKKGAEYIADNLAPIIRKYSSAASTVTYKDSERPETFGDLAPSSDEILDGGKDMPYHVVANAQGIRMNEDVTFPKKKKHVLFMGDSGIFCPFLNNENTITGVLQLLFPDMVIMNTGTIGYTLEDYVTLWNEKTKYTEPDIVFVQTNGLDMVDYFFSQRNKLSRSHKPFYPSDKELAYYKKHFDANN